MASGNNFQHFVSAQRDTFDDALTEVQNGRKTSHWMWFIFPQLGGLGSSEMSKKFAIRDLEEAAGYLNDEVTGPKLIQITSLLLLQNNKTAHDIFGSPDDMKLRSSMTLFSLLPDANPVFQQVLDKYFDGEKDPRTLELLAL